MAKWQVKGNKHHHDDGKVYPVGSVIEDPRDLAALFKNKFDRLPDTPNAPVQPVGKAGTQPSKPKGSGGEKTPAGAPDNGRGDEVTGDFPVAHDEGFQVYRRGSWYHVFEDDEAEAPINKKGLRSEDVEDFIKKHLEE